MKRSVWASMLALLLVATVFFGGCSAQEVKEVAKKAKNKAVVIIHKAQDKAEEAAKKVQDKAEAVVQKAQNEVVEFALEATVDAVMDNALVELDQAAPVVESLQGKVELQVVSSQITQEGMTATCQVSAPDITEFVETLDVNDYTNDDGTLNEDKLLNDLMAAIDGAPVTQQEVTVGLQSTENGYVPTDMEAFVNACTGGMLDALMELYGDYLPQ